MINLYKDYIENKLREAGVKGKIYKTMKELKQFTGVELAAVIPAEESFERNGAKGYITKEEGKRYLRKKIYKRTTNVLVVISNKNDSATDEIMCRFMSLLERGINDGNGNWVDIECKKGEWIDESDSIIRNNIAIQLLVTFTGGIYNDKSTTSINNIEFGGIYVEKNNNTGTI